MNKKFKPVPAGSDSGVFQCVSSAFVPWSKTPQPESVDCILQRDPGLTGITEL